MKALDARFLDRQRRWSDSAFGPGKRTEGVCKHIESELDEVRDHPDELSEWIDVMILAVDGATRRGYTGQQVIDAYKAKVAENMGREWPDWRLFTEDEPIEHIKEHGPGHFEVVSAEGNGSVEHIDHVLKHLRYQDQTDKES